jgi:cell division protein FtsI (penicillin-binding protein 3)
MGLQQSTKVVIIFSVFILLVTILFGRFFYVATGKRDLANTQIKEKDKAKRGGIITSDGYRMAYTTKVYTASVDTRDLPKENETIFTKMFSIYSGIEQGEILEKIRSRRGNVILAKNLSFQQFQGLKKLAEEFRATKILTSRTHNGENIYVGLSVYESGAERTYPYEDVLTPLLGYTDEFYEGKYSRVRGVKGLEKKFEEFLAPQRDGYFIGSKDARGMTILDSDLKREERIDGNDLHLNINLSLQKKIEIILSKYRKDLRAKEVIASVIESDTGNVLALATSNRFTRKDLKDLSYLNVSAVEYTFEPGSVMKPIIFSIMLDEKLIWRGQYVDCENGKYKIGTRIITDEHPMKLVPVEDILIHSSNIGMAKLVKDFDPLSFYNGLQKFGFSKKSGLEIGREVVGNVNPLLELQRHIYRTTASYGYGMTANFMQMMRAYNIFNNDGKIVDPKVVAYLKNGENVTSNFPRESTTIENSQIIDISTARKMKSILVETVKLGTGSGADIIGLEIGGKTGTAHIAEGGKYVKRYHSSFFGFANDEQQNYTIGVTVIDIVENYFASQSAVPIFKNVIEIMLEDHLLKKRD